MADNEKKNATKKRNYSNRRKKGAKDKTNKDSASTTTGATVSAASALLSAAANLSFPTTAGYPIHVVNSDGYYDFDDVPALRIPGVMRLGYVATFGDLTSWVSPANVWLRDLYTVIRHQNSGHANYDAADLGYYLLSYRSCLDYLYWMERLYGVMMGSYVPKNAYTPSDLVHACGGEYSSLLDNLAQLRFYITSFAARLNQMKVPDLRFFAMGRELLSNIYADSDNPKASFYVFDPDAFWSFNLGNSASATYMEAVYKPPYQGYNDIRNMGENLLNAVMNNEDFNIMSGDIMKAFSTYAPVPVIEEGFTLTPVFDGGVLWAIKNATYLYDNMTDAEDTIRHWRIQTNLGPDVRYSGALQMKADVEAPNSHELNIKDGHLTFLTQDFIVDLPSDAPDASSVGYVTRFKCGLTPIPSEQDDNINHYEVISCQCEVLTSAMMISEPRGAFHPVNVYNVGEIAMFDYHPFIPTLLARWDTEYSIMRVTTHSGHMIIGDVTNITNMTHDTKRNIDMAVMLDVFSLK